MMSRAKILVVAPSNAAADNIAEKLNCDPQYAGKFLRVYGDKLEDTFHFTKEQLTEEPYRVLSHFVNSNYASQGLMEILENKDFNA